ncbi:[citrate (pro-3S)-lyase] ligase [Acetobacter papayae]|uniref:[citrate (pro-3S)-lyase] ligase n=1 Tax=Acetobacter papayae TaxID=1076592 RepID=UPI0004716A6B|nr:[citrate (pro-3S)-lyase] ligase [Acetobacter papayae]
MMLRFVRKTHFAAVSIIVISGEDLIDYRTRIEKFLQNNGLDMDARIAKFVVAMNDCDANIVACAGLDGNIVKCVCVDQTYRGSELSLVIGTELVKQAFQDGHDDLFLYTKEKNKQRFNGWGFSPLVVTKGGVTFMEYNKRKLENYLQSLRSKRTSGKCIGSIVMNANPFTKGHRYLVERAAAECDCVHVFMVKEDVSFFRYKDRFKLVKDGLQDLNNVILHPGSDYIVSHATFPQYFIKDKHQVNRQASAVDALMFRQYIAPALGISVRYVGSEPIDETTSMYNCVLKEYLELSTGSAPPVELREMKRLECCGSVISASRVRALMKSESIRPIEALVPKNTFVFIEKYLMTSQKQKEFL